MPKDQDIYRAVHNALEGYVDQIGKSRKRKDVWTFRRTFFYTHKVTSEAISKKVMHELNKIAFIKAELLDHGEVWKAFKGGSTIKNGSHWWVDVKIERSDNG